MKSLKGYAQSLRQLALKNASRWVPYSAETGLRYVEPGERAYRACADLSDLASVHRRTIDPRCISVSSDETRPVLIGPWLMEVGFELIYWIPFVRAELARLGVPRERVVAVSRGGAEPWYRELSDRYLDVLDLLTPEELYAVTAQTAEEKARKLFCYNEFESHLLGRAAARAGIGSYDFIMPSAMYGLFRNAWRSRLGGKAIMDHLALAPLPAPPALDRSLLPFEGDYVAVKFYFSNAFRRSPQTEAFCRDLVRTLAKRTHVVLLSNSARLDDHDTVGFAGETRYTVFDAGSLYGPRDNLTVQTALVANAAAFHGTYGGFSYLGPLLGVDSFAYVGNYKFISTHLDLAFQMIDRFGTARLALMPASPAVTALLALPSPSPRLVDGPVASRLF